ncbi:unnamed protein product [Dovyalis caffra]|uniref:C2 domain-containing protein n=1 Tax=Dovyalis caffra TaxID=77055 RepID=A0AAV1RIJ8_9ROSI|nr:unnamed protein product [Dovyalis caffra]
MECRPLEITVTSAKDLKDVDVFGKMDVYCIVSIKGDPYKSKQKQQTHVHKDSGPNPLWNFPMKFTIDEAAAQQHRLKIKFKLRAKRMMGDKDVGVVVVPVKELLDAKDRKGLLSYAVKTPAGKMKGTLNFSFNFGEIFNAPTPAKTLDKCGQDMVEPKGGISMVAKPSAYLNKVVKIRHSPKDDWKDRIFD